jgi:hypothetical protein
MVDSRYHPSETLSVSLHSPFYSAKTFFGSHFT